MRQLERCTANHGLRPKRVTSSDRSLRKIDMRDRRNSRHAICPLRLALRRIEMTLEQKEREGSLTGSLPLRLSVFV